MPLEVLLLIFVVGTAAFLTGLIYFTIRVMGGFLHLFSRLFGASPKVPHKRHVASRRQPEVLVCDQPQCRKVESRAARYCSQCGARLDRSSVSE